MIGQRVRAKVVKNKVAPPFRMAEFDMMHANGISYEGDVLDMAMAAKLVTRTGAWFRYGDMQLGQGREKVRDYLKENPKLVEELKEKILAAGMTVAAGRRGRRAGRRAGRIRGERRGERGERQRTGKASRDCGRGAFGGIMPLTPIIVVAIIRHKSETGS